jgi:hypothetical protein
MSFCIYLFSGFQNIIQNIKYIDSCNFKLQIVNYKTIRSHSIIDLLEQLGFSLSDLFWVWLSRNWKDESYLFLDYRAGLHPFWLVVLNGDPTILLFPQNLLNLPPWSDWLSQRNGVLLWEHVLSKFQLGTMD